MGGKYRYVLAVFLVLMTGYCWTLDITLRARVFYTLCTLWLLVTSRA